MCVYCMMFQKSLYIYSKRTHDVSASDGVSKVSYVSPKRTHDVDISDGFPKSLYMSPKLTHDVGTLDSFQKYIYVYPKRTHDVGISEGVWKISLSVPKADPWCGHIRWCFKIIFICLQSGPMPWVYQMVLQKSLYMSQKLTHDVITLDSFQKSLYMSPKRTQL